MPTKRISDLKRRVASTSSGETTIVRMPTLAASVLLLAGAIHLGWPAAPAPPAPTADAPVVAPTPTDGEAEASLASPPPRGGAVRIPAAIGGPRRPPVMAV